MLGESAKQAENFAQLLGEEAARSVHVLMRRSLRWAPPHKNSNSPWLGGSCTRP